MANGRYDRTINPWYEHECLVDALVSKGREAGAFGYVATAAATSVQRSRCGLPGYIA